MKYELLVMVPASSDEEVFKRLEKVVGSAVVHTYLYAGDRDVLFHVATEDMARIGDGLESCRQGRGWNFGEVPVEEEEEEEDA